MPVNALSVGANEWCPRCRKHGVPRGSGPDFFMRLLQWHMSKRNAPTGSESFLLDGNPHSVLYNGPFQTSIAFGWDVTPQEINQVSWDNGIESSVEITLWNPSSQRDLTRVGGAICDAVREEKMQAWWWRACGRANCSLTCQCKCCGYSLHFLCHRTAPDDSKVEVQKVLAAFLTAEPDLDKGCTACYVNLPQLFGAGQAP